MKSWNNPVGLFVLLALILLAAVLLSLFTGSSQLTLAEVWRQWRSGETTETAYRIFLYARLPRTIAALAAGAALAVSGALVQAVLNNALASPGQGFLPFWQDPSCRRCHTLCPSLLFWGR